MFFLNNAKVDDFLNALMKYEKENIPDVCRQAVQQYLQKPDFNPEFIRTKSVAGKILEVVYK